MSVQFHTPDGWNYSKLFKLLSVEFPVAKIQSHCRFAELYNHSRDVNEEMAGQRWRCLKRIYLKNSQDLTMHQHFSTLE